MDDSNFLRVLARKPIVQLIAGTIIVSMAPIILHDPEKLYLDEPISGVIFQETVEIASLTTSSSSPISLSHIYAALNDRS